MYIPCTFGVAADNVRVCLDLEISRKGWARLIQKICEVAPLVCPKGKGTMRIIRFIEDPSVIRDILTHLGLWLIRSRPPPKIHHPPNIEYTPPLMPSHRHPVQGYRG